VPTKPGETPQFKGGRGFGEVTDPSNWWNVCRGVVGPSPGEELQEKTGGESSKTIKRNVCDHIAQGKNLRHGVFGHGQSDRVGLTRQKAFGCGKRIQKIRLGVVQGGLRHFFWKRLVQRGSICWVSKCGKKVRGTKKKTVGRCGAQGMEGFVARTATHFVGKLRRLKKVTNAGKPHCWGEACIRGKERTGVENWC